MNISERPIDSSKYRLHGILWDIFESLEDQNDVYDKFLGIFVTIYDYLFRYVWTFKSNWTQIKIQVHGSRTFLRNSKSLYFARQIELW